MATKLAKLRINEISGVDEPANEMPDWIVLKGKEILGEIERIEKSASSLRELLDSEEIFKGASDKVLKANETLSGYLDDVLQDEDDEDETAEKATGSVKDRLRTIFGVQKAESSEEEEEDNEEESEGDEEDSPDVSKAEAESDADDEDEDKEDEDDEEDAEDSVDATTKAKDEDGADVEDEDEEDEEPEDNVDKQVLKQLLDGNDLIREAVLNLTDRIEILEGSERASLPGQEASVTKRAPTLEDGMRAAMRGNRVTLR